MLSTLANIFSFFAQNPLAGIAAIGYFFLTFGSAAERKEYFDRVFSLLTDPTTLQKDKEYYNEKFFQNVENNLKEFLLNGPIKNVTDSLGSTIANSKNDWKKLTGWFLLGLFLIVFLIADLITIQNLAEVMKIELTIEFPAIFYDFGLAVTIGTFFSLVAAGFILFELYSKLGFTDFAEDTYKDISKYLKIGGWILFGSSMAVVIFLALKALAVRVVLPVGLENFINILAEIGVTVLVRFNAFFASVLIFSEAIKSLKTVMVILAIPAFLIMGVLFLTSGLVSILIRFILDLVYRFFLWLMWTISFLIFSPGDKILSAPKNIMEFIQSLRNK